MSFNSMSCLKKTQGTVYVLSAFMAVPFTLVLFYVLDLTQSGIYRMQIQQAMNSAAIAAARYDLASASSNADTLFYENLTHNILPISKEDLSLDVTTNPDQITLETTYGFNGLLHTFLGISWTIKDSITVERRTGGVEFSIVLNRVSGSSIDSSLAPTFSYFFNNASHSTIYGAVIPCCSTSDALYLTSNDTTLTNFLQSLQNQTQVSFSGIDIAHNNVLDPGSTEAPTPPKNYNASDNLKYILYITDNHTIDANFSTECTNAKAEGIKIGVISVGASIDSSTLTAYDNCATHQDWHYNVSSAGDIPEVITFISKQVLPIRVL